MTIEIAPADKEKWYLRIAMNWFIKKYSGGKNSKEINEEMENCGNSVIRYIRRLKKELHDNISPREKHQRRMVNELGDFLLWIMYKDTAYRQMFFWALKHMMEDKDDLMPVINEYYREPKDWYVNVWSDAKQKTKDLRKQGKLKEGQLSEEEKYFVPSITYARIQEEEMERKSKKMGY